MREHARIHVYRFLREHACRHIITTKRYFVIIWLIKIRNQLAFEELTLLAALFLKTEANSEIGFFRHQSQLSMCCLN